MLYRDLISYYFLILIKYCQLIRSLAKPGGVAKITKSIYKAYFGHFSLPFERHFSVKCSPDNKTYASTTLHVRKPN